MPGQNKTFSILITTKNRISDLKFTLEKIQHLLDRQDVECIICDDGSTDETFKFIKENYPKVILYRNIVSKGYLFCRNKMLNETKADYALSLDDDAHFLTENPLEKIQTHFEQNPSCGLLALRIFWGLNQPEQTNSAEKPHRVKSFVGCGHVWNMQAWAAIPNYPEWFVFYGEEDFAAYQLFKKNWEIYYLPAVLVHHRVDVKSRRNNADYALRLQRSLRSGWYLYFMFYPWQRIPRLLAYSLWIQTKNKVLKGDLKAFKAIVLAIFDVIINFPKLLRQSNRLSVKEFEQYSNLTNTKIYWKPENGNQNHSHHFCC